MIKVLRKISLVLIVMFTVSIVFAGCGSQTSSNKEVSSQVSQESTKSQEPIDPKQAEIAKGEVKLVMYLLGDAPTDGQLVYDEINKKLKTDINTTVQVNNIPWADFSKKYQLIFASGEEFDCAYATNWCLYNELATKNAFMEIKEDMIKTYAPETYADLDPFYVKGSKVKGKMYMIPANAHDVRGNLALIRGDLREKNGLPEVKTIDDFYNYLITVTKNDNIIGYNGSSNDDKWYKPLYLSNNGRNAINLTQVVEVNTFDEAPKVFNGLVTPEYLAYAKKMVELKQAGVFPKNMLSAKTPAGDNFKVGTSAACIDEPNGLFQKKSQVDKDHPEWKTELVDLSNPNFPMCGLSPTDSGLVINANSTHPERVLMMLNQFRENREYHDLTYLGISGKHWEPVGDNKFRELQPASKAFEFNGDCPWAWTNDKFKRYDEATPQGLLDIKEQWKSREKAAPILTFAFDDTAVKNEGAAITNVLAKYVPILNFGFSTDVEKVIAEANDELNKAGLEKYTKEVQNQIDSWLIDYNK